MCHHAALVVQILFATRVLGLSAGTVGLCYIALGLGTVTAGIFGHRISRHFGAGPTMILGIAVCGSGWSLASVAPASALGVAAFAAMLTLFGIGATLVFINFLALRQAATPAPLLGRMTSTMRWLILIPAGPGALFGGWLGEQLGLRAALGFAGAGSLALVLAAWRRPIIRTTRTLPQPSPHKARAEAEALPETQPGEFVP
jgi:MFS family permease